MPARRRHGTQNRGGGTPFGVLLFGGSRPWKGGIPNGQRESRLLSGGFAGLQDGLADVGDGPQVAAGGRLVLGFHDHAHHGLCITGAKVNPAVGEIEPQTVGDVHRGVLELRHRQFLNPPGLLLIGDEFVLVHEVAADLLH